MGTCLFSRSRIQKVANTMILPRGPLALLFAFAFLWIPIVSPGSAVVGRIILAIILLLGSAVGLIWLWTRSIDRLWNGRLMVLEAIDLLVALVTMGALPWYAAWLFDSATQVGGLGVPVTGNFAYAMVRCLMGSMFSATAGGFGGAFQPISTFAFAWGFIVRLAGISIISVTIGSAVQWFILRKKVIRKDDRRQQHHHIVSNNTTPMRANPTSFTRSLKPLRVLNVHAPAQMRVHLGKK